MENLVLQFINSVLPSVIVFIVGVLFLYFTKGLNFLSNNSTVMNVVSTIAANEPLRKLALNLCIYAQKYVSKIAMEKLQFVVNQLEDYCIQSSQQYHR